ncbi:MAG: NADH-quinone oxidoreductase subunit NuoN [Pseudomonadota bacterium]
MIGAVENWQAAGPEIILTLGTLASIVLGVVAVPTNGTFTRVTGFVGALFIAAFVVLIVVPSAPTAAFGGLYVLDPFTTFMKALVLIGSFAALIMMRPFLERKKLHRFEIPLLVLLATLGMCIMVSSGSLLTLYIGLELQSLSLYVLAALDRDSRISTEAGLKYFVLGAVASGMLLFGSSLIYGFAGTTSFSVLAEQLPALLDGRLPGVGLIFGLVFLLAGLAFKVSAVPFHMWTPDVYEGAPTAVTAFFASAPKVASMALFIRIILDALPALSPQWTQIIYAMALLSMVLGAFAAIPQPSIKRLLAYSSIGHVGYALMGLAVGTPEAIAATTFYMAIYMVTTIGAFACVLAMRTDTGDTDQIEALSGLRQARPWLALAFACFMLSLLGFPPFAGFFGKLFVFQAAIEADMILLAVVAALTSAVAAYYYLRIIKIMYFDDLDQPLLGSDDRPSALIMIASAVFASPLFVIVWPALWDGAQAAAKSLG